MRILITGANGQLGAELLALLEPQSHHIVLGVDLDRPGMGSYDLTDRDAALGLVTGWAPDLVLHTAAFIAVDRCETEVELAYRSNCLATRFVADGARRVGAHVVYVSTDHVFNGRKVGPYTEWDLPDPQSVYGRTKLGGELEMDPGWTVARTSWLFSPRGDNTVRTLLRLADEGQDVSFVDDQVGRPTAAADLALMVAKLGVERVPGTFHTTNQGAVSWYEFAREVFSAAGHDPDKVRAISTSELTPPRAAPRPANSDLGDLAWRGHGFEPSRDFRDPLAEVIRALRG